MVDYAIFGDCRLRGVGLVRGVSLPSPIHLTRRPYNAGHTIAVWPCDKRLRTRCYTVEANYRQTVEQPLYDIRASCLFFFLAYAARPCTVFSLAAFLPCCTRCGRQSLVAENPQPEPVTSVCVFTERVSVVSAMLHLLHFDELGCCNACLMYNES